MNVEEKWAEMVSTSKDNIETFNDFFEDKATVWANSEIRRLRAENEALRQTSRDLALFVQRFSRRLRAARAGTGTFEGDTSLEEQAMKFLKRNGLSMSIEANAVEVTADAKLFHGEGD